MLMQTVFHRTVTSVLAAMFAVSGTAVSAQASMPRPRGAATDLGRANPGQMTSVIVHLKRPNEALFTKTVDALYDRNSPTFHHWLTDAQLAQFGPTAAQVATVRAELQRNGLTVASIARDGSSIRAVGPLALVSRAFHTDIHQYALNGKIFRTGTRPPALSGQAQAYVSLVSGIESHTVRPMYVRAVNLKTKKPLPSYKLSKVAELGGLSALITDEILGPKHTFSYTTSGTFPKAVYKGESYDPDATLVPDYTPKQLENVLGMPAAYKQGLTGAGQTIVLLEGYGYPNMLADANAFAKLTGLPALTAANFGAVYPEGVPDPQAGYLTGWNVEIALDIDWAHAIAPGAKIMVVATNGQDSQDFEASMQYIIDNHLGNAVSDSWEEDLDLLAGPAEQEPFEDILTDGAAKGISFQFSTGDGGDSGLGTPVGAAGVPSVAPHATAVGGTAIQNVPNEDTFTTTGWGDTLDVVADDGNDSPISPADDFLIYLGGGGGGSSVFWPKPAWQRDLPGFYRQTPDISALADPYTGVPIVTSDPIDGQQLYVGYGGTSLASPIFTAIWAIANQRAGHPLGQASPTIAALKSGVEDVLPITTPFSGSYTASSGNTTKYTAESLFTYLVENEGFSNQKVFATVWDQPQYEQSAVFAFGLDSSLSVTPGWDNATGYGTPKGLDFIEAAAHY
jgi:subtilase family serine protease